jgi:hypothetical protein
MKHTIQLNVAIPEAEKFVRQMAMQGYEVGTEKAKYGDKHDYHFKLDGETSILYSVTIDYENDQAWVGVRPI